MTNRLYSKVYGCLLGGIIGDAMGAPVEGMDYWKIQEKFGEVTDFKGEGTDDSAIKMILCEAIINNSGYITADEFAASFLKNKNRYYNLFFIPVKNMLHKIESKLSLPVYAGMGNMQSSSSAMAISPMGLINACNPRQAAIETYDVAGLVHAGDSTFCRDAACALAAATAEALKPDATVDSVLDAATLYLHKTSSQEIITEIKNTLKLAKETGDYEKFRESFYKSGLRDIICDSRETVPCALALFSLSDGDPVQAVIYGANFGRDADTIATMTGSLAGAFKGVEALPGHWVSRVENSFSDKVDNTENLSGDKLNAQERLANKIIDIIEKRFEEQRNIIKLYDSLK